MKDCEGKTKHPTHKAACTAAEIAYDRSRRILNVYKCEKCGKWHCGDGGGLLRELHKNKKLK